MSDINDINDINEDCATPSEVEKRQKRDFCEVDPDSPESLAPSDARLLELLNIALKPTNATLSEIKANQIEQQKDNVRLRNRIEDLTRQNEDMKTRVNHLEKENQALRRKTINMEMQSRRCNLKFHGLPETERENAEEVVQTFLNSKGLSFPNRAFERAHRLGRKTDKHIRPIIVRMSHFKDRDSIWSQLGHNLFPPSFNSEHVREDYPEEIEKNRSILMSVASAALKVKLPATQEKTKVRLVIDTLYINSQKYTVNTLSLLPENLKPAAIYTPMTEDQVAFFTSNSPLSNHYISEFTHDGKNFNCMEQFIVCEKAKLCGDSESLASVLKEDDPVKQKNIGKFLSDFDDNLWKSKAQDLILPGLQAKFEQCLECKNMLIRTGDRRIFEANPHDEFWGIGLSLFSKDLWSEANHKGKNVLGKSLEIVRSKIRRM